MNDYEHMMQMVGPTMNAFFPEPDGPLPEERDQPDDREEMEEQVLVSLYDLVLDGVAFCQVAEMKTDGTYKNAARIAAALGLSKEWERMVGK